MPIPGAPAVAALEPGSTLAARDPAAHELPCVLGEGGAAVADLSVGSPDSAAVAVSPDMRQLDQGGPWPMSSSPGRPAPHSVLGAEMWRPRTLCARRLPPSQTPALSPAVAVPWRLHAQHSVLRRWPGDASWRRGAGRPLQLSHAVLTSQWPGFGKYHHPCWLEAQAKRYSCDKMRWVQV